MARFDEADEGSVARLSVFKKSKALFCLDWQKLGLELSGTWIKDRSFKAIDVMMVPCGTNYTLADGSVPEIRDDCVEDEQEVIDYLGMLQVTAYHNDRSVQQDKYDDERLLQYSTFEQVVASPAYASWIQVYFSKSRLYDETEFLQLGGVDEIEYEKFSFGNSEPSIYQEWPSKENNF